ncbi:MAG TPA: molecular chaperone HtpG [Gammaproteobacteria bacterium]|jgi:molecular chaperone HtpG|nr:molecular chaperone HtpG [Gammaproteobacteria bacterium]
MTVDTHKETLEFQTEVKQLLQLMIHSLYSNKEIFLRELISNGSDACDKLRFEALGNDALYEDDSTLRIRIDFDEDERTVTISDTGIGMTRDEVVDNIGTIAKSGTRQFFESLTGDQAKDSQLIGQFGVGFYSAFIVADRVSLTTRRAGLPAEQGVHWESSGDGSFTLETVERKARGTEVVLHLREGEDEFLDDFRLRNIIHKYSDHIPLPIEMLQEKSAGEEQAPREYQPVNKASALWTRPRNEISDEEYKEFYKHVAHDFEDPMTWVHSHVEGAQSYKSLFYIPARAPFDLYDRDSRHGIKLYVNRVFIMDDAEQLMPYYLRFVRGLVDSDDLPLNVSREILQHNKLIDTIRAGSIKKVLGMLETMAKDAPEQYAGFWAQFGKVIKEGPGEDFANRERIAKLLRFASTDTGMDAQTVSFDDYIGRMKEGQGKIYFVTADNFAAAASSPHLQIFRRKGIEVLLLSDRVDEWLVSHLHEYDGKQLVSVAKGKLDLDALADEAEKEAAKKIEGEFADMVKRMQTVLDERVQEVRISQRLTDSPSCLVMGEHDMAVHMQQMLKQAGHDVPETKPVLEINPTHPLVSRLQDEADDSRFSSWANILLDQAMLSEGGQLADPAGFVNRLNELLQDMTKTG